MRTELAVLLPVLALAASPPAAGCRRDGQAGEAPPRTPADSPEEEGVGSGAPLPAIDGIPAVLGAFLQLPDAGEPRWLNATIVAGEDGWFIAGCASRYVGTCHWNPRRELDPAERQAYAERIAAVRATPRCEPVAVDPDDLPFDLDLDGEGRSGHIPQSWFADEDSGPPREDTDPCRADVRLMWWIYETLAAHGRLGLDGPAPAPLPECSEACCGPDERAPDPAGMIECCFCEPI